MNNECSECGSEMTVFETEVKAWALRIVDFEFRLEVWGIDSVCVPCSQLPEPNYWEIEAEAYNKGYEDGLARKAEP